MPGKIIVIANQKGGAGKTTSALLIATELPKMSKRSVIVVDADTQNSAVKRVEKEDENKPFPFEVRNFKDIIHDDEHLQQALEQEANDFGYVIVDTKGKRDSWDENKVLLLLADMIIIPVQPEQTVIDATADTINDYEELVKPLYEQKGLTPPEIRVLWLLPKPSEYLAIDKAVKASFDEYLESMGIKSFAEPMHNWSEIKRSAAYAEPISSLQPGGKAVKSARNICKEILTIIPKG